MRNLTWIALLTVGMNLVHSTSGTIGTDCFVPSKSPVRLSNDDPPSIRNNNKPSTPSPTKCITQAPSATPTSSPTASATVQGTVWNDLDGDGIREPNETSNQGVTVNLLDCNGNVLQTTKSLNFGSYIFERIKPGCVQVEFKPPSDLTFTSTSQGQNPNIDSDPDPETGRTPNVNLLPGQTIQADAGLVPKTNPPTKSPTAAPTESATVSGFIWDDIDADGNRDINEPGIDGVDVVLLDCEDNILQTTSSSGGAYSFDGVTPGCIYVGFIGPDDYTFPEEGGNPELQVDRDLNIGLSPDKDLLPGDIFVVDVGLIRFTSSPSMTPTTSGDLRGFVWEDKNRNGIQDADEPEFVDVTVNLFDCNNVNQPVQSTSTNSLGMFSFEDVKPSCYFYKFDAPDRWGFSPANRGSDDEIDSDADSMGKTPSVTLVQGGELSMDAGLQCLGDERASEIYRVLQTVSSKSDLDNRATPQGKAYRWILNDDPLLLCPGFGTDCQFIQRYVLAVFYFSTRGDDWLFCGANEATPCEMNPNPDQTCRVTTRWLSSDNECDWCGNTCNSDFCLTEIQIERNNQNGPIPNEISKLLNVTDIRLERGRLNGRIPETIRELTKLKFLDLDFQELTGSIPEGLWEMTKMEQLDLNNNMLTGTIDSRIGTFVDMTFLQLFNNKFVGTIPDTFSGLTKLRTAQFEGNEFSGTMPASICQHRSTVAPFTDNALTRLRADCGGQVPRVQCDSPTCCTYCYP